MAILQIGRTVIAPLRINKTSIATIAAGGTRVDAANPAVRRALNLTMGRWVIMDGAPGLSVPSADTSTITVGTEAGDAIDVTIQLKDAFGVNIARVCSVECWLSSDATTGAVDSDTLTAVTATTGSIVAEHTDDLYFKCVTNASGQLVLHIADTDDEDPNYLWVDFPADARVLVSGAINFA